MYHVILEEGKKVHCTVSVGLDKLATQNCFLEHHGHLTKFLLTDVM